MSGKTALAMAVGLVLSGAASAHDLVGRAIEAHGAPVHHVAGAALLKLKLDDDKGALDAAARELKLKGVRERTGVSLQYVKPSAIGWALYRVQDLDDAVSRPRYVPTEEETLELIGRLRSDEGIDGVAVNGWRRPYLTPNDEHLGLMWHLGAIDAEGAWNISTGSPGQRVGVVDTGIIRAHEDLSAKDVAGYDFISDPTVGNDGDGMDAQYNDPGDAGDCGQGFQPDSWHGTHVSGTIVASANNGQGLAGLNWGAGLVTVRGLGVCGGSDDDIMSGMAWLAGYDWQTDPNNPMPVPPLGNADVAEVINMSLGGPGNCSQFQQAVIDYANNNGTLVVIASGNEAGPVASPANCTGAIAVGAHGPNNDLSGFSNTGPQTAVYAPGGSGNNPEDWVLSSYGPGTGDYNFLPGTSMASPHVAGAVSLMLDLNPTLDRDQVVALFDQGTTCGGCDAPTLQLYDTLAAVTPGEDPPAEIDDVLEDNDVLNSATPFNCGDTLSLQALDDDFYEVDLPEGASFHAVLTPTGTGDIDLALVDANGIPLKAPSEQAGNTPEEQEFTLAGAPAYLRAYPWNDAANGNDNHGPYTLSLSCTDAPETAPEPDVVVEPDPDPDPVPDPEVPGGIVAVDNDDLASALEVRCGEELRLLVDDDDWFTVPVENDTLLSVRTSADTAPAFVSIMSRGGHTLIAESVGDGLEQTATRGGLGEGLYAVRVRAPEGQTSYTLNVQCFEGGALEGGAGGCSHLGAQSSAPWGLAALFILPLALRRRRRR